MTEQRRHLTASSGGVLSFVKWGDRSVTLPQPGKNGSTLSTINKKGISFINYTPDDNRHHTTTLQEIDVMDNYLCITQPNFENDTIHAISCKFQTHSLKPRTEVLKERHLLLFSFFLFGNKP